MGKILFLGTAGDSLTMGRQSRASGGILFEMSHMQFLLNPGPGSLVCAKDNDVHPREITGVLVTQNNILNAGDVNAVVDAMSNGGLDSRGVVICHPDVVSGNDKFSPALSPYHKGCVERVFPIKLEDRVAIGEVEVKPTRTTVDYYGFKLSNDRYVISYMGETTYEKDICAQHKDADVLIFSLQKKITTPEDILLFIEHIKPHLVIVTGFGIKYDEITVLNTVRDIQKKSGVYTVAAKDGMSINPASYAKNERQKKL